MQNVAGLPSRAARRPILTVLISYKDPAPSLTRLLLLAAALLLLPLPSRAGSWVVAFSGTAQATPAQGAAQNYTIPNTSGPSVFYGEPASLTMTVTTTLTWTPSGPGDTSKPPPEAVLEEYLGAGGSVSSNPAGGVTIKANDGVGTAPITGSPQGGSSVEAQTDYYVGIPVPAGATSVQGPTRTLTASLAYSGSASSPLVWVDYGVVQVDSVTLAPGGATQDSAGNYDILVGQRCSPALAVTYGSGTSTTLSGTVSYSWSVTGTTFQSWSATASASTYTPTPSTIAGQSPTGWYWNDMSTTPETVTCTATVTPPAGQGSAFTITATQKVSVYVPSWNCTGTGGNVQVSVDPNGNPNHDYWLWAGPLAGANSTGGMAWNATLSPPTSPVTFGAGTVSMVQLIIPNMSYTENYNYSFVWSTNGQEGLDTSYPYPWVQQPPQYAAYFAGDAPGLDLSGTDASNAHIGDQFEDYLMYTAPGSSQPVPLGHFVWTTSGSAALPNSGGWAAFASNPAGTVTPSSTATKFLPQNSFPAWTQNDAVADGQWLVTNAP